MCKCLYYFASSAINFAAYLKSNQWNIIPEGGYLGTATLHIKNYIQHATTKYSRSTLDWQREIYMWLTWFWVSKHIFHIMPKGELFNFSGTVL